MTATSNTRKPYTGTNRALVLALDVGTTFSGVSYAILEPGEVPKIHGVTRFPGQEHVAGNSKIPSIIFYDADGNVKAAGAEADSAQIVSQAEDEGWMQVELFKLRLRPKTMKLDMNGMKLSPLPKGKSSGDVFGDFLRYLFQCTRRFIEDTHANGIALWKAVEKDLHVVLSHPNGWEGAQQSKMRRSAISAGLIPDTDEGKSRIRFVTEGEASLHACVLNGLAADVLSKQTGNGFIVADAGGGTLDISSYAIRGTSPLIIEEIAPADCVFAGAVFVSRRARVFLEEKLKFSKYGTPDALDHITKRFDETTKRLFRDKNEPQFIPFGSPLDKDLKVGIRGGQLKLTGAEVAELFEPSIEAAVNSIKSQIQASAGTVKAVWLVGGFAANPWLFTQLQERLATLKVTVNRPDTQTSKAVADGAIGFFCDHHVSARMSKYMYGVEYLREVNMEDQEHVTRQGRLLQLPSGPKLLPDAFDCILAKNVRVKESSVFSRKYYTEVTKISTLSLFEVEIWCYRGGEDIPKWILRDSDQFGSLCFVQADLSKLSDSAQAKIGTNGTTYWTIVFSIEIHFGLTEFKARMKWNDDGRTRYGPATIVYNERGRTEDDESATLADDDRHAREKRHDKHRSAPSSRTRSKERSETSSPRHSRAEYASSDTVKSDTGDRSSRRKSKGKEREVVPESAPPEDQVLSTSQEPEKPSGSSRRSRAASLRDTLKEVFSRGGDKKDASAPSTRPQSIVEVSPPSTQDHVMTREASRSSQTNQSSMPADPLANQGSTTQVNPPDVPEITTSNDSGAVIPDLAYLKQCAANMPHTSDNSGPVIPDLSLLSAAAAAATADASPIQESASPSSSENPSGAQTATNEERDKEQASQSGKKAAKKGKKGGSTHGSEATADVKSEKASEGPEEDKGKSEEHPPAPSDAPNDATAAPDTPSNMMAHETGAGDGALQPSAGNTGEAVALEGSSLTTAPAGEGHVQEAGEPLTAESTTNDGSSSQPTASQETPAAETSIEKEPAVPPVSGEPEGAPEPTAQTNDVPVTDTAADQPNPATSDTLSPPEQSAGGSSSSPKVTSTPVPEEVTGDSAAGPNSDAAEDKEKGSDATGTKPPPSPAVGGAKLKKLPKPKGPGKGKGKGKGKASETEGEGAANQDASVEPSKGDEGKDTGANDTANGDSAAKDDTSGGNLWGGNGGGDGGWGGMLD